MLVWLKRKAAPAPSEQSLETEDQKPITDARLGRMLGRLGSDSGAPSEPVTLVLNRIDPLPSTDSIADSEPAAAALNEIDSPPSAESGADDRFTLRRADRTMTDRGQRPSAAELLAKGYSFATGPDGKMLIYDADGQSVDIALPLAGTDGMTAGEPAPEAPKEADPLPSTDSMVAVEPVAEAANAIDSLSAGDAGTASEPMAEALNEITPLARTRRKTAREPAAEVVDEINPPARSGGKAAGAPAQMRVIAVASQKGGSGKTTIAAHLAVQAGRVGEGPAVLIDTDPQGSLGEWWHARSDDTPALASVKPEALAANLAELRSYGTAIAIVDTPPALTGSIEQVIAIADLIVIPVRASPHDLRAVGATVEMARKAGKPFLFVINGASPRAAITAQAVAALSEHGRVAPVILYQRTEYAASMIDGRTVMEKAGAGRSAHEIAELWQCVYEQIRMRVAA